MVKCITARRFKRTVLPLAAGLLLSACHSCDYTINSERLDDSAAKSPTAMWLNFDRGESQDPYQMEVNRIDRGYAIEAPISAHDNVSSRMTVSKSSDSGWFVGPHLSFSF